MEIFVLGNTEEMSQMFFLRNGMNYSLFIQKFLENLGRVLPVFNQEKNQEKIGGHVVSECKEGEFEGIGVVDFGFMEEISNVSWP